MKTIEEYLKDLTAYDVTDGAIDNALINVKVASGTDVSDLSVRQRELCSAWIYYWCVTAPNVSIRSKDADGGWSHEDEKDMTSGDRKVLLRMANDIFMKYGINVGKSPMKLSARGMRVFPRR